MSTAKIAVIGYIDHRRWVTRRVVIETIEFRIYHQIVSRKLLFDQYYPLEEHSGSLTWPACVDLCHFSSQYS
jgi:hypothetical protein